MRTLHAVSPLATLERGYAIVTDAAGTVVTTPPALAPGARIEARLARGRCIATVTGVVAAATGPADSAKKPARPSEEVMTSTQSRVQPQRWARSSA